MQKKPVYAPTPLPILFLQLIGAMVGGCVLIYYAPDIFERVLLDPLLLAGSIAHYLYSGITG